MVATMADLGCTAEWKGAVKTRIQVHSFALGAAQRENVYWPSLQSVIWSDDFRLGMGTKMRDGRWLWQHRHRSAERRFSALLLPIRWT